uniref:Uncharacterized protein n=1 Tax=Biomphalaria glabrata TaxID=6526 RepID=A0A2C9LNA6_BIOGL
MMTITHRIMFSASATSTTSETSTASATLTTSETSTASETSCAATLIPVTHWRYQYDVVGFPSGNLKLYFFIIVDTSLQEAVEINNVSRPLTCSNITGTNWTGCVYNAWNSPEELYHIQLKYHQSKLGVYLYAYDMDRNSVTCTALGVTDYLNSNDFFSDTDFIRTLSVLPTDTIPPYICKKSPLKDTISVSPTSTVVCNKSSTGYFNELSTQTSITLSLTIPPSPSMVASLSSKYPSTAEQTSTFFSSTSSPSKTEGTFTSLSAKTSSITTTITLVTSTFLPSQKMSTLSSGSTSTTSVPTALLSSTTTSSSPMTTTPAENTTQTTDATQITTTASTTISEEIVNRIVMGIVKNLTVEKQNISAFRRTKECVKDYRPSSNVMGFTGILMLTFVGAVICGYDIVTAALFLFNWLKTKLVRNHTENKQEDNKDRIY